MHCLHASRTRALFTAVSAGALGIALGAAIAGPSRAQDAGAQVVVTASRIQSAGFTAPTPTTVLSATDVQHRAPTTLLESLNDLPAFRPTTTPQNSASPTNGANSGAGGSRIDLRGLTVSRTLLLVNGHRTGASQDLNQFPTILTSRVDVVTGGASADYGSDAVAGVVNIVLDTKFNGVKGNIQYGQTRYNDDKTGSGSIAFGTNFLGDRGHILIGGEYSNSGGARTADPITSDPRPWIRANRGLQVTNPCPRAAAVSTTCPTGGNGLPPFVDADNINFSTMNPGGVIVGGKGGATPNALAGITFDDGGVSRPFKYGILLGNNQLGGEGVNPSIFFLRPATGRYAFLAHTDFKVTDKINFWTEVAQSKNDSKVLAVRPRDQANLTISNTNAFLPASILSQMNALKITSLTMGRFNNDGGQPTSEVISNTYRLAFGFDGALPWSGWTWDAAGQYGRSNTTAVTHGSRNTAKWLQALDSIVVGGVAQCRNTADGCAPFNVFGPNMASSQARAFVFGLQAQSTNLTQTNFTFNLHGQPVSTWAGPVAVAAGAEYRKEETLNLSDPIAAAGGWDSGNTKPLAGSFNVLEGYAEVAVPLARDMIFAHALDFNGAVRYANYSTAGGVLTYKMGGTWEPIEEVLLRATVSRDIRAPNISELFTAGASSSNNITQFQGPKAGVGGLVAFITTGNPNLKPEQADTMTIGATWRPKFARLRVSADYYSIRVNQVIQTVTGQVAVDQCAKGDAQFCSLLTWDTPDGKQAPNASIISVANKFVNNSSFTTRGWDLEGSFIQPLRELPGALPGTITTHAVATEVLEFATIDQTGKTDRSGQNATAIAGTLGMPRWTVSGSMTYDLDQLSFGAQWRWMSSGVVETTSIDGTSTERLNNKIPDITVTNLFASYNLINTEGRKFQVYGAVNNVTNVGPPFPVFALTQFGFNYDALGTVYRMGVRFQY